MYIRLKCQTSVLLFKYDKNPLDHLNQQNCYTTRWGWMGDHNAHLDFCVLVIIIYLFDDDIFTFQHPGTYNNSNCLSGQLGRSFVSHNLSVIFFLVKSSFIQFIINGLKATESCQNILKYISFTVLLFAIKQQNVFCPIFIRFWNLIASQLHCR